MAVPNENGSSQTPCCFYGTARLQLWQMHGPRLEERLACPGSSALTPIAYPRS